MTAVNASKALIPLLAAVIVASAYAVRADQQLKRPSAALGTCSAPRDVTETSRCAEWQRQILDATVFLRFTLHCGRDGDLSQVALIPSHATIVDSRTLLTHDHYHPLGDPACAIASLEVATAWGEPIAEIEEATELDDLALQLRSDAPGGGIQTRVVRFASSLFAPVPALAYEIADQAPLRAVFVDTGELAQINWEPFPKSTWVQWVKPVALERRGDALGLVVDRSIEIGASGGGLFRITPAGVVHVGNTWGTWRDDGLSIVALNQAAVFDR